MAHPSHCLQPTSPKKARTHHITLQISPALDEYRKRVRTKLIDEGVTQEQKASMIHEVTEMLSRTLNKDPATTFVVIDEVALDNWGIGGLPVLEYRARLKSNR